jgi:hypothetical protein
MLPNGRLGSRAPHTIRPRQQRMSAVAPIATKLVRRGGPPLCAITGREQMQQTNVGQCGYSITSSARASTVAGRSRPSALAVLRLITVSYLVGACTGRSASFSLGGCGPHMRPHAGTGRSGHPPSSGEGLESVASPYGLPRPSHHSR